MRIKSATEENDIISKSDSKRKKGLRLPLPIDLEISPANHVFLSESSYQNLRNEDKNQKKSSPAFSHICPFIIYHKQR
jgi:hypothetical protein